MSIQLNDTRQMDLKLFQLIVSILFATSVSGQIEQLNFLYPDDSILARNNVVKVTNLHDGISHEYDTLGREIAWYYEDSPVKTYFQFELKDDTLVKKHYYIKNDSLHPVYQVEKFVYNEFGNILFYCSNQKNYQKTAVTSDVTVNKFQYGINGELLFRYVYKNKIYPFVFSETFQVIDSLLFLVNVYEYSYNKLNQLTVIREARCQRNFCDTDSFFYDSDGKIINKIHYTNKSLGGASDLLYITDFSFLYQDSVIIETQTESVVGTSLYGADKVRISNIRETLYNRQGLLIRAFYISSRTGARQITIENIYVQTSE